MTFFNTTVSIFANFNAEHPKGGQRKKPLMGYSIEQDCSSFLKNPTAVIATRMDVTKMMTNET